MTDEREPVFEYLDEEWRLDLARKLASGMVGWLHSLSSRNIGYLADEDAARVEACIIVHSQRHPFYVRKDIVPNDWGTNVRQVDIGIGRIDDPDLVLYGAIELKWSSGKFSGNVRNEIIQDIVRLASIKPKDRAIRFLLMGGGLNLNDVFTEEHKKTELAKQRDFLHELLSQDLSMPTAGVSMNDLQAEFPDCFQRLPTPAFRDYDGIATTLLANAVLSREETVTEQPGTIATLTWGQVRLWQIDPVRATNEAS